MPDGSNLLLGISILTLALVPGVWRYGPALLRVLQILALVVMLRCVDLARNSAQGDWQPVAVMSFVLCLPAGLTVFSQDWRAWLAGRLRAGGATFRADSMRHSAALTLMLAVVGCSLAWAAVTDDWTDPWDLPALFMSASLFVVFSALGVGYPLRRNWPRTCARLGLWLPEGRGLLLAAGVGIVLVALVSLFWLLWALVTWPQSAADDSSQLAPGLLTALLSAAMTAVGEETMFRGVLQPVFGIALTSFCFTLLHARPGAEFVLLPIFGVSLAFAWLRLRHGTLAAICAHFCYNFTLGLTSHWYSV